MIPWLNVRTLAGCLLAVWAVGSLSGCSKKPFPLAYTTGTCTCNGVPMSAGLIILSPVYDPAIHGQKQLVGKPAQGLIQPDGSFVLSTYKPNDGAVIGKHAVELSLAVLDEDSPKQPCQFAARGLIVTIEPGENQIEIELAKSSAGK